MKKVLYCASTDAHILNFHIPYLRVLKELGCEVWVAANGNASIPYTDKVYRTNFTKSLISLKNIGEVLSICRLLKKERFDLIHTHTALAAAIVRLAVLFKGKGRTKVLNTSHGYFFWSGAMFLKWLIYLPVEYICGRVTDCVITMNQEDFNLAQKYHLSHGSVYNINGMGIDSNKYMSTSDDEKFELRKHYGFCKEDFILIYSAEFSKRKNHIELFHAINLLKDKIPNLKLLCAGQGALNNELHEFVDKFELNENIKFLGYINNLDRFYPMCDLIVSSSISEGLPFNIMEGMACGVPVVASRIKGHTDLVKEGKSGLLYNPSNYRQLADDIFYMYDNVSFRKECAIMGRDIVQSYTIDNVLDRMISIYKEFI